MDSYKECKTIQSQNCERGHGMRKLRKGFLIGGLGLSLLMSASHGRIRSYQC